MDDTTFAEYLFIPNNVDFSMMFEGLIASPICIIHLATHNEVLARIIMKKI